MKSIMKTIQLILLMILVCLLCASSCKETEPKVWTELPPATQTGENTMGCLVDGQLWATGKLLGSFKFPAMSATYIDYGDYVHLSFGAQGKEGGIYFLLNDPQIGENTAKVDWYFNFRQDCTGSAEITKGLFITKMDLDEGIISGYFAFDVPCGEDTNKILHITEGRFDMYLSVY